MPIGTIFQRDKYTTLIKMSNEPVCNSLSVCMDALHSINLKFDFKLDDFINLNISKPIIRNLFETDWSGQ